MCMLIVCVIFLVIFLYVRVNGGLFTSGAMTFYCMYVFVLVLVFELNNYVCMFVLKDGDLSLIFLVIGFVFVLFVFGVIAYSVSFKSAFVGEGVEGSEDFMLMFNVIFFYFVFFIVSFYCVMIFMEWMNGWSVVGWESVWVKVAAAYASVAFYTWVLFVFFVLCNCEFC